LLDFINHSQNSNSVSYSKLTLLPPRQSISITQSHFTSIQIPHYTIMSGVLTMQIVHALFPSLRDTSTPSHSRSGSNIDTVIPRIHIQPAEDLELRPLLNALNRQPAVRHRRSSSASSTRTRRNSLDNLSAMPRTVFTMDPR
jgi:hypothetical protein